MARGIYKRGTVHWIRYAGLDGRIIRESSGSRKFSDARDMLIKRQNTVKEGKQPEPIKKIGNHSFQNIVAEYLRWTERQRSFRSKAGFIRQLSDAFGALPLRRFNTMLIEQYQQRGFRRGISLPRSTGS